MEKREQETKVRAPQVGTFQMTSLNKAELVKVAPLV